MTVEGDRMAYGIVFVGQPGQFSVWQLTPQGELMDRDAAERLGQMAALAGAADYRVFPLDPVQSVGDRAGFVGMESLTHYDEILVASSGIPPSTQPVPEARIQDAGPSGHNS
jgi:hypothetical protein